MSGVCVVCAMRCRAGGRLSSSKLVLLPRQLVCATCECVRARPYIVSHVSSTVCASPAKINYARSVSFSGTFMCKTHRPAYSAPASPTAAISARANIDVVSLHPLASRSSVYWRFEIPAFSRSRHLAGGVHALDRPLRLCISSRGFENATARTMAQCYTQLAHFAAPLRGTSSRQLRAPRRPPGTEIQNRTSRCPARASLRDATSYTRRCIPPASCRIALDSVRVIVSKIDMIVRRLAHTPSAQLDVHRPCRVGTAPGGSEMQ